MTKMTLTWSSLDKSNTHKSIWGTENYYFNVNLAKFNDLSLIKPKLMQNFPFIQIHDHKDTKYAGTKFFEFDK